MACKEDLNILLSKSRRREKLAQLSPEFRRKLMGTLDIYLKDCPIKAHKQPKKLKTVTDDTKPPEDLPVEPIDDPLVEHLSDSDESHVDSLSPQFPQTPTPLQLAVEPPPPEFPVNEEITSTAQSAMDLLPPQTKEVSCMVSLKTALEDIQTIQLSRLTLDVVCVIDVSKSMEGENLSLVKDTLLFLSEILSEYDRIGLVTFNNKAKVECPLVKLDKEGKALYTAGVQQMKAIGGTDIESGLKAAIDLLPTDPSMCNDFTTVMLLADGGDDRFEDINERLNGLFNMSQTRLPQKFSLPTFGYGSKHDPVCLTQISERFGSNYYNIETQKNIALAFIRCLGELVSTRACGIHVDIVSQPCEVDVEIARVYSENGDTSFDLPAMSAADQKSIVFDLNVNVDKPIDATIRPVRIDISFMGAKTGQIMRESTELELHLSSDIRASEAKLNQDVLLSFCRLKTALGIKEVLNAAKQGEFSMATRIADATLKELRSHILVTEPEVAKLIEEVEQAKASVKTSEDWENGGLARLYSTYKGHMNQKCSGDSDTYENELQKSIRQKATERGFL